MIAEFRLLRNATLLSWSLAGISIFFRGAPIFIERLWRSQKYEDI
jgi:hypothetical protein